MQRFYRMPLIIAPLLLWAPCLPAQAAADPSGHWEGTVQIPGREINFEIDLAKNAKGQFTGTISVPGDNLKGLPLRKVSVEGKSVAFEARSDQPFAGVLAADEQEILGGYSFENFSIPFRLKRNGDARMEEPAKIAPVRQELEGTWDGTLTADGKPYRLVLTLSNGADGTAMGKVVSFNEGELEIPVSAITQAGSNVVIEFKSLGASYTATWNNESTELAGTYRKGELVAPLKFRRHGNAQK